MNEMIQLMKTRRSCRKFKSDAVSSEILEQIAEAGLWAPSGMGKQDQIFLCITNKEIRDKLSDLNRKVLGQKEGFDPFYGAPAVIVVLAEKGFMTSVQDGSLAMQNLMLATHSLGLGSCWIHRAKEVFESDEGKKILSDLGVKGEYEGVGHCIVGYIDGDLPSPAPRNANRVFFAN